jgi:hypothetical protein
MRPDPCVTGRACASDSRMEWVRWANVPVRGGEDVSQEMPVWNSSPLDSFQNGVSEKAIGRENSFDGLVAQHFACYQGGARSLSTSPRDRGHSTTDYFSFLKKRRCASWSLRAGAGERERQSRFTCYWKKPRATPHATRCFPLTDGSPSGVPRAACPRRAGVSWRQTRASWRHVPAVAFKSPSQATTRTHP